MTVPDTGQPAAYWTGLAYQSLIAFTRARQAEHGFSQPQFWLLRNLSRHDISPHGHAMTISELREAMRTYLRPEDDLAAEASTLTERGWLAREPGDRYRLTEAGEQARRDLQQHTPAILARIHEGISDADYATTLRVLHRMIVNTGGALP